jgi:hypothetical protein
MPPRVRARTPAGLMERWGGEEEGGEAREGGGEDAYEGREEG